MKMKMKKKTFKTLLIATLLSNITAMAMTAKVDDKNKVVHEVIKGESKGTQKKFGLPIDVSYKSEHVDVGVSSNVNITISTKLTKGTLKVNLRPLDENSIDIEEKDLEFTLTKEENSFPIELQLTSQKSGIHYINLSMSVKGKGSKVVAIPVNIGTISKKLNNNSTVEKTKEGTAISVASAEEEIK